MGATVYFWHAFRFDVFHVNPPLTRVIVGLPVVMSRPNYDRSRHSSLPQARSEWGLGKAFIAANSPNRIRQCFALARWSLIPLLVVGGYFGYQLSREMYGKAASSLFLTLWCFSPLLLAWGATICPDAVAAALGIVAIYTFRRWLHNPNWKRVAMAGVCLGVLPLTKLTWTIAFALWPVIWCAWTVPMYLTNTESRSLQLPPCRQLAAVLFIGLYTLNAGYLFDGTCCPLNEYVFVSQSLSGQSVPEGQQSPVPGNRFTGTWLGAIPVPVPAEFVQGIDTQRYDFERGLPSYLRGQWADHGWWYYYLYALAIKEPLGMWCLVALAIGATSFGNGYSASWRDEMIVLMPLVAILASVSSQTGFSAHPRYVIPALPFLFIWTSKIARVFERPFTRKRLVTATAVGLALTWLVSSSLSVYPHSLSYFNELAAILPTPADASYPKPIDADDEPHGMWSTIKHVITAGPRNGPRHLLGSNIDWGQDLLYLKDWLNDHPDVKLNGLAYYNSFSATLLGIPETPFPALFANDQPNHLDRCNEGLGPKAGWYALSVNYIYSRDRQHRYFLHFEPVATAGYSICIYHIAIDEANRVRRELGLEELNEGGEALRD